MMNEEWLIVVIKIIIPCIVSFFGLATALVPVQNFGLQAIEPGRRYGRGAKRSGSPSMGSPFGVNQRRRSSDQKITKFEGFQFRDSP